MWVRSQDRMTTINAEAFEIEMGCVIFGYAFQKSYLLGEYHDEDEAMEVMDEIMGRLNDDCYQVYEMPVSQYYEGEAKEDIPKELGTDKKWKNNIPDYNDDPNVPF